MASIHAHGRGFRVHYTLHGVKDKSDTLPTYEAAAAWMRDNLPAVQDASTLNLVDLWVQEEPSDYRQEAAERIRRLVRMRGWNEPERLTASDLKAWTRDDPAWRRPCQYLRTLLRWAAREHRIAIRQDFLDWKPPKAGRRAKPPLLTDAQVSLILDKAADMGPAAHALIDYLATYGARPITACRLRLPALDLEHGEIELGMLDAVTGRRGEKHSGGWRHRLYARHLEAWPALTADWFVMPAPIELEAVPVFPHYAERRPWRIKGGKAGELAAWYVNRIGRPLKEHLGKLIGIYHLKRYAITRLFRAGVDPESIALFTGHLDRNQVMTYAVSNADLQEDALRRLEALGSQGGSLVPKKST